MYVDNNIKLMEKVPELLTIMGFLKSFLMSAGYEITVKTTKMISTIPIAPKRYLIYGSMSCNRFPKDSIARINPVIGIGMFLIMFIVS